MDWAGITALITGVIMSLCGLVTAIATAHKSIMSSKKTSAEYKKIQNEHNVLQKDMEVTREGIIQAFTNAKFPTNYKIDLSNKVEKILNEWFIKLVDTIMAKDEIRTRLMIFISKILYNTAAYNKLTDEEKIELQNLLSSCQLINIDEPIEMPDNTPNTKDSK